MAKNKVPQVDYMVMYVDTTVETKDKLVKLSLKAPNIRSLARALNTLKRKHPHYKVLAAYVTDGKGKHIANVRFLQSEYSAQRWLTGYKERLLANAIEIYGMDDIKWRSGLNTVSLVVV